MYFYVLISLLIAVLVLSFLFHKRSGVSRQSIQSRQSMALKLAVYLNQFLRVFLPTLLKSVFVAAENFSYSVHEFSHAAVSPKSLCLIKMYHIVISRVNNVFELDKESTVSFFQERGDYTPLCVKVFFFVKPYLNSLLVCISATKTIWTRWR